MGSSEDFLWHAILWVHLCAICEWAIFENSVADWALSRQFLADILLDYEMKILAGLSWSQVGNILGILVYEKISFFTSFFILFPHSFIEWIFQCDKLYSIIWYIVALDMCSWDVTLQ